MKITKEQFEGIEDTRQYGTTKEYHQQLEEYTGIYARPYTAYQYFDSSGNYIGDSSDCTTRDLLKSAYIEIGD